MRAIVCVVFPILAVAQAAAQDRQPVLRPAAFVPNSGQWDPRVRFRAECEDLTVWVERDAWTLVAPDLCIRIRLAGGAAVAVTGEQVLAARHSYFVGTASRWRRALPAYAQVRCHAVWPGIDLVLRTEQGRLHYDVELAPGADVDHVRLLAEGLPAPRSEQGGLVHEMDAGRLRQSAPIAWSERSGQRRPLRCAFQVGDDGSWSFSLGDVPAGARVVIDPGFDWSTYAGGRMSDEGQDIAFGPDGDVFVTGWTLSNDFPTTQGAFDRSYNGTATQPRPIGDGFLLRLRAQDGALVAATYFGGAQNDFPVTVHTGASGDVFVTGWTGSSDFPTTAGAFDETFNGLGQGNLYWGGDLFAARFDPTLTQLRWGTYVGGSDLEYVLSADLDAAEALTFSGHVHSPDFPTTPGAYSRQLSAWSDAFVTRLDASGSKLLFSTYFGGTTGEEYGMALVVGPDGSTTFGGATDSTDLPTTPGAYDRTMNGGRRHLADGFVARLDATGGRLLFSTFLGSPDDDTVYALGLRRDGSVLVAGETNSPQFPITQDASDPTHGGGLDAFVVHLDAAGAQLLHGTFLGADLDDVARALVSDRGGGCIVVGGTQSAAFPTTAGAAQRIHRGSSDLFAVHYDDRFRVRYATLLGGTSWDDAPGAALTADGRIAMAGYSWSGDYPVTPGAMQQTNAGQSDTIVTLLDGLASGLLRYGRGVRGCVGNSVPWAWPQPAVGAADFAIVVTGAVPSAAGALLLGAPTSTPLKLAGIELWLDFSAPFAVLPGVATAEGGATWSLPIPNDPRWRGAFAGAQAIWADACGGQGLAASPAIALLVQ